MVTIVLVIPFDHTSKDSGAHIELWTVAGAKARLSEVIERAQTNPQLITRHGKPCAVIDSAEEWARKTARKGSLAEFLLGSPLHGADVDVERVREQRRVVDL